MAPPDLLGSDSEDSNEKESARHNPHDDNKLVVNRRYAKSFQLRKQREDLRGSAHETNEDDDSDESSEEDVDGALLTTRLDTDIAKTLHLLRSKDRRIYDPAVRFFDNDSDSDNDSDEETKREETSRNKAKPKRYKDVVREQALAMMEKKEESESGEDDAGHDDNQALRLPARASHRLAYDQEQQAIRESFLQSTRETEGSSNEEKNQTAEDDLLVVRKRPQTDAEAEEEEAAFVQEMEKLQKSVASSSKAAGEHALVDPKGEVDDGDQFLFKYFAQRAWKEKDDDDSSSSDSGDDNEHNSHRGDERLPMKGKESSKEDDDVSLDRLDDADDFEARYNFRFEDAAAATTASGAEFSLISYARSGTDAAVASLRRDDNRRKEQRAARKARKEAARKAKEEELKRLKNIRKQDMERKLRQVKQVMGLSTAASSAFDGGDVVFKNDNIDEAALLKLMEGDYDPEDFERKMEETFGDDYYAQEDREWKTDVDVRESLRKDEDGNLLIGQDGEEGDLYDHTTDDEDVGDEDETGEDYDEQEQWVDNKDGHAEALESGENETELEKKLKSKMQEELYKLDYEDIVAGMPTRFKYRQVEANDYGLTTEEILLARDNVLKQYVSLKKMAPYREDGEFRAGGKRRRRFREMVQQQIDEELGAAAEGDDARAEPSPIAKNDSPQKRKRRRNKKKKTKDTDDSAAEAETRSNSLAAVTQGKTSSEEASVETQSHSPKRRRRQKKKKSPGNDVSAEGDALPSRMPDSVSGEASPGAPPSNHQDSTNKPSKKDKKRKKAHKHVFPGVEKKLKKKKFSVDGLSGNRIASYGL